MILFVATEAELADVLVTQTQTLRNPSTGEVRQTTSRRPDWEAIDELPNWQVDDPEDLVARALRVDRDAAAHEIARMEENESGTMLRLSPAACDAIRKSSAETLGGYDIASEMDAEKRVFLVED